MRFLALPSLSRRRWFVALASLTVGTTTAKVSGQQTPSRQQFGEKFGEHRNYSDGVQVDLKQQLEKGLRARRPEEFAFIDRVVIMVYQGQLSRSLVNSTFDWARRKRPYPFVYFQRGLIVRAARMGVTVQ